MSDRASAKNDRASGVSPKTTVNRGWKERAEFGSSTRQRLTRRMTGRSIGVLAAKIKGMPRKNSPPYSPLRGGPLGPSLPALPEAARALTPRSAGGRSGLHSPLCRRPLGPWRSRYFLRFLGRGDATFRVGAARFATFLAGFGRGFFADFVAGRVVAVGA